ncbi:MAG TPA: ABC transporter ATP-binding protein [Candidatus Moranbacteria bacterium]|nr:ABC transporter ATP-binding protein [Candidatus Moranbacteria bacterium]
MELKEKLVEMEKVNLTYNRGKDNAFQALFDVNVTIKKGEFVVILGPSGCGKSSLLNIIAGLEAPDTGSVKINDVDVLKMKATERIQFHRSKIGMVFQSYNLITTLSVLDNVALPQIFINTRKSERERKVMVLLERFGIKEQWKKIPSQLSGGQQQRIGIARAIVNDPFLILADEPVGNLDSASANNVMQIMGELNKQEGRTIVLVTHNPENAAWGSHIIYMKDGKITKEEWKDASGVSHEAESRVEEGKSVFDKIMEKFRGLSEKQIGFLMEPLKAKLVAESFFIPYEESQMKIIEESIRLKMSGVYNEQAFFEQLDKPVEKGGAGLDQRIAKSFTVELEALAQVAGKVFGKYSSEEKAKFVIEYFTKKREIHINEESIGKVTDLIKKRVNDEIPFIDFKKMLDTPQNLGGAGLDKRTVHKILRELDLVLIVGFGLKLEPEKKEEARIVKSNQPKII